MYGNDCNDATTRTRPVVFSESSFEPLGMLLAVHQMGLVPPGLAERPKSMILRLKEGARTGSSGAPITWEVR